ncbi:alpha/beta fold hydrolase [Actinomadura citrea]|uniref:Pimeloyl-ACP methyl ester carboxylesterase n=1 Tax=Actinomadura citrea TaxID=46158 RepID=A0A7Y9KHZ0_9ACTN|nr:alpha/beta hydrolase [Actinomadura citrea]NYE16538.1 pimeloyl-ACP methyl ester carboxylesterase [Actinomadura citrea]GGT56321.1 alpha/beta hydrolase [Actinomadura citrea]
MSVHHARIPVAGHSLHVAESGDPSGRPYLFLHGWPESWRTWRDVMAAAPPGVRLVAADLPGIGGSTGATCGSKRALASVVHDLVRHLGLDDLTLVGHDAGGMVAYAYLRRYEAARVVIMNTAIPGVAPWDAVIASPTIWHFGLHAVPGLPETLVRGRQAEYFDHFYDVLSADPSRITPDARAAHAAAYGTDASLTAGFDLYRAFAQDAEDNAALTGPVTTPVLYLRGDGEGGDIAAYAEGFRKAGVENLTTATIRDTGHFSQEEQPAAVWAEIHAFAAREG